MKPAETRLEPELRALTVTDPRIPVVANVDAQPKTEASTAIDALVRQVSAPVRWEEVMRHLVNAGVRIFVEVGPGAVLCRLGKKTTREATFVNIAEPDDLASVEAAYASYELR